MFREFQKQILFCTHNIARKEVYGNHVINITLTTFSLYLKQDSIYFLCSERLLPVWGILQSLSFFLPIQIYQILMAKFIPLKSHCIDSIASLFKLSFKVWRMRLMHSMWGSWEAEGEEGICKFLHQLGMADQWVQMKLAWTWCWLGDLLYNRHAWKNKEVEPWLETNHQ